MTAPRPAVFLDRDGTIAEEMGYLNHLSRFRLFPFAAAAIRRLNERGLPVVVVTNQSGVSRGFFPEELVERVHEEMKRQLAAAGARIEAIYYCPHSLREGCTCRKPLPGMLERAAREHNLDLARSWVVGDRYDDVRLAHGTGGRGILVLTGYGMGEHTWNRAGWPRPPEHVADTLADAVDFILREAT